ncbi:hypothetical protein WKW50_24575 [Ochrobactrum sp. GPK 3]|uniref:hypothetical protein n=1 Tax=Brucella sp. 22210 TaxID=3453892 RepID=UPI0031384EF4
MNLFSILSARKPEESISEERIVAVAVKLGSLVSTMPPPARHDDLVTGIFREMGQTIVSEQEGFLTSKGRFVSKQDARGIAISARQIDPNCPVLVSQHLW